MLVKWKMPLDKYWSNRFLRLHIVGEYYILNLVKLNIFHILTSYTTNTYFCQSKRTIYFLTVEHSERVSTMDPEQAKTTEKEKGVEEMVRDPVPFVKIRFS